MENLILEQSFKTPEISFQASNGDLLLKGRVFPENPEEFFSPVIHWLQQYSLNPAPETRLKLCLSYFNSTSSEYIFRICKMMEGITRSGNDARIIWQYEVEDEDMRQIGEDYADILKINFELKAVN